MAAMKLWYVSEPVIHSHVTDVLDDNHPLAYKIVDCQKCGSMVHCSNNECMQTWLEWGLYILCGECAAPLIATGVLEATEFKALTEKKDVG